MQNTKTKTFIKLRPTFEDEFMLSKNFIQTSESQFTFTDVDNLQFLTSHIYDEQSTNKIVFELSICDHITKSIAHHTQPLLFFFGQPLSGKTYTIEGLINKDSSTQEPGILHHIHQFIQNQRADVSLAVLIYSKDQLYDAQSVQQQQIIPGQQPKFTSIFTQETINDIILMSRKKVKQLKFEACSKIYHFKYVTNGSVFNYYVVDSCLYLDQQLNLTLQQALYHILNQQSKQHKGPVPGLRNNKLLHYLSPCLNINVADILFGLNISGCEKFCDFRKIQDIFIKIFSGQHVQQDVSQTFTRSQLNIGASLVQSQSGIQRTYQQPTTTSTKQPSVYKSQLLNDLYQQEVQQKAINDQGQMYGQQRSVSPSYMSNTATINFTDATQTTPQVEQNNFLDVEEQDIYQQPLQPRIPQSGFQAQSRVQGNNSINMSQVPQPQISIQNTNTQYNTNQTNIANEMEQFSQMLTNHPQMLSVNPGTVQPEAQIYGQQNNTFQPNNEFTRSKFQQINQNDYNQSQIAASQRENQPTLYQQQSYTKQSMPQQQQINHQSNSLLNNQYNQNTNYQSGYQPSQNQTVFSQGRQSQMQQASQVFSNVSDLQCFLDQQKTLTINTAKQFVQQKLQEKNVLIETLRVQVNDLQHQLDEWKLQCQTVKNLQETEKELQIQQSEQTQAYKAHISQLLTQLNISKVQSSDYKQELDRQMFINNQQVDQMNHYKAKIQSLETEIGTLHAQLTAKDDQLLLNEQQITELSNNQLEWKTKCNQYNLELNELRPYKDVAYEMEVEITDYKNTISQKEVEIEQLKNEVISLRCIVQQQSGAQKVEEIQI